jgi:hypothetical protein
VNLSISSLAGRDAGDRSRSWVFLEFGFAPTLAAVSVITLLLPLILVAIIERVSGLGDFIYGRSRPWPEPALRLCGIEKHYATVAAVAVSIST